MAEYTYDILAAGIEQGTTGQPGDQPQPERVRNIGFAEMHGFTTSVTLTATASTAKTVQVCFQGYSSANSNDIICNLAWYNSPHTFDLSSYSGIKYFRIVIRYSDSSNITPSAITSAILTEAYSTQWRIQNDIFTHDWLPSMIPKLVPPYPIGMWYIEDDEFKQDYLPSQITNGAFADCTSLVQVSIPHTMEKIGEQSFINTNLTAVTIPADCEYSDTTFPPRCIINYYIG